MRTTDEEVYDDVPEIDVTEGWGGGGEDPTHDDDTGYDGPRGTAQRRGIGRIFSPSETTATMR